MGLGPKAGIDYPAPPTLCKLNLGDRFPTVLACLSGIRVDNRLHSQPFHIPSDMSFLGSGTMSCSYLYDSSHLVIGGEGLNGLPVNKSSLDWLFF